MNRGGTPQAKFAFAMNGDKIPLLCPIIRLKGLVLFNTQGEGNVQTRPGNPHLS